MFGKNEIVGRKYFDATTTLMVTSLFLTLQGEGPYQGRPAIFLRLSKCNLNCSFCDTFFDKGEWLSISYLIDKILDLAHDYKHDVGVVITGGEPSLQSKNLNQLLRFLVTRNLFNFVQVESNGILPFDGLIPQCTLVVSPKCAEKGGRATRYLQPNDAALQRADCLKFVMSGDPDSVYHTIPGWAFAWRYETGRSIYLSPMNEYRKVPEQMWEAHQLDDFVIRSTTGEIVSFWDPELLDYKANQRNHEHAARYAMKHGLYLTLQQQLYASMA